MFYLAKFIQAVGFSDVAYALYVGISDAQGMGREMRLLLIGVAIFYVGRAVERRVAK
jgi:hypothetical protein